MAGTGLWDLCITGCRVAADYSYVDRLKTNNRVVRCKSATTLATGWLCANTGSLHRSCPGIRGYSGNAWDIFHAPRCVVPLRWRQNSISLAFTSTPIGI